MLEIKRKSNYDGFAFAATENGSTLAEISACIDGKTVCVEEYSGDESLFDAMFRALINSAELVGGAESVKTDVKLVKLLKDNGLPSEIPSISGFFAVKHCGGNCSECKEQCK